MKKAILKSLALAAALGTLSQAALADDIRLGVPGYGGNGCPSGSASVTLSPDQKALTIIFDQFLVEAGAFKTLDRKSCNIAIPVHIPQGFSVSILEADYRGFNSLPSGAYSQFAAEYFFAGQRGPKIRKTFRGPIDSDYLVENNLTVTGLVWSACGADVNLRVNASMLVKTNRYREDALATVDTADFKAGMVYKLQWRRCR